jgi:hypothetical protein
MEGEPLAANYVTRCDRRRGSSPTVSVVIASNDSEDMLESRISSLRTRFDPAHTEYVVAWAGSGHMAADLRRRFPYVHFISATPSTSPADLRMQGMKAATGDIVLLLQHSDAQGVDLPDVAIVNTADGVRERSSSPKWVERLALRGTRENAAAASNG